jgi:hypothetical protein
MSQNVWATIMPFGPVTLIFYWSKKKFRACLRLALISDTGFKLEDGRILPEKNVFVICVMLVKLESLVQMA